MRKRNILFIVIGLLLIIIPFFISYYSIYKLISILIGIIILIVGLTLKTNHQILKIILLPLFIPIIIYLIDYYTFLVFKKVPIMSIKYISSSKVSTYNSLMYRIYDCNGKYIIDKKSNKNYACSKDDIPLLSVNDLMGNMSQSFKKYNNRFVHLKGKISSIISDNSFYLNAYDGVIDINGYVTFDPTKKIKVNNLKIDPSKYHVYDEIELIGLVYSYNHFDSEEVISIKDAKIIKTSLYSNYELNVNNTFNEEKVKILDSIYYIGIDNIYYKYDENNIYELKYLLSDKRENIDAIIKDQDYEETEDGNKLYKFKEYNLLMCKKDIIFVNKSFKIKDKMCE